MKTHDPSDEALTTRSLLSLNFRTENPSPGQNVLSWEGKLEQIANQPLSLSIIAQFQAVEAKKEEEEEEGGIGGLFGALARQGAEKRKAKTEKMVTYNAILKAGEEVLASGKSSPDKGAITRIVLQIKFEALGEALSECERVLFEKSESQKEPPLFQRHALLISGN